VGCETRKLLDSKAQSAAHHLESRLKSSDSADSKWDLEEIKRTAKDLLDALHELWDHEDNHACNL
jgi:hypothetical protein